jgi:dihydroorotate dehydrogenase
MGLYRSVVRPLAFVIPPEAAHHLVGAALAAPLPWRQIGGAVSGPGLRTDLAGIELSNPIGLAAGFDKNARMVAGLARLGFGYVVIGTVCRFPRTGNPAPRIVRTPAQGSLTNAMGIPNDGVEAVASRLRGRTFDAPVLASIADEEPEDVVAVYERLAPLVAACELNVSSPNSPWRHSGRDNVSHLRDVMAALGQSRKGPLFVKLPPFRSAEERESVLELATIAVDGGANGLTCANTWPVTEPRLSTGRGGLSGAPLSPHTPPMIEALRAVFPDVALNASGGIMGIRDARDCLEAGATTVQVYTGLIYGGPRLLRELTSGLAGLE